VLQTRECTPTLPFVVFIFGLIIESIKELESVSIAKRKKKEDDDQHEDRD
jgi:hypothetical protein